LSRQQEIILHIPIPMGSPIIMDARQLFKTNYKKWRLPPLRKFQIRNLCFHKTVSSLIFELQYSVASPRRESSDQRSGIQMLDPMSEVRNHTSIVSVMNVVHEVSCGFSTVPTLGLGDTVWCNHTHFRY